MPVSSRRTMSPLRPPELWFSPSRTRSRAWNSLRSTCSGFIAAPSPLGTPTPGRSQPSSSTTRATRALVVSWPEAVGEEAVGPAVFYEAARDALGGEEEIHEEELFGPAEGLHSSYRMLRDEVLEASWRAGSARSEMRLDTAEDVTQAVARYLELVKLAALVQRPGD